MHWLGGGGGDAHAVTAVGVAVAAHAVTAVGVAVAVVWIVGVRGRRLWGNALAGVFIQDLAVFAASSALTFAHIVDDIFTCTALISRSGADSFASVKGGDICLSSALAGLTWVKSLAVAALILALILGEAVARVWVLVVALGALKLFSADLSAVGITGEIAGHVDGDAGAVILVKDGAVFALNGALALALLLVELEVA